MTSSLSPMAFSSCDFAAFSVSLLDWQQSGCWSPRVSHILSPQPNASTSIHHTRALPQVLELVCNSRIDSCGKWQHGGIAPILQGLLPSMAPCLPSVFLSIPSACCRSSA